MRSEACWARVAVSGQNRSVLADNAAAESFLGTLKKELVKERLPGPFDSPLLDRPWYKPCRLHSSVGHQPRNEWEDRYYAHGRCSTRKASPSECRSSTAA